MSDDRVIQYLRTRAQVEPERELVARVMAAVEVAPPARSPFAALLPAAAIAGAVAVLIALALIVIQGPNVGPNPTDSVEPTPSPATIEELQAAVESGVDVLIEAPGVEGIGTSSVLGELAAATWFSWRPSGDQVVISRSDVDVEQTAWWLEPGAEPPNRGENVTTQVQVLVGDDYFTANDGTWAVQTRDEFHGVLSLATGILDGDVLAREGLVGNASGVPVMKRDPDGTTIWTLTVPYRNGRATAEWRIAPDGSLASWSTQLVDVAPTTEDAPFVTHAQLEFVPLSDPEPIEAPDPETPPDPEALGLPPDFPLEPAAP